MKKPSDFKIGEVYEMRPARRSHVRRSYYVIINDVSNDRIETYIPDKHALEILHRSPEWEYHIPRMRFVGTDAKSRGLVLNQDFLLAE